MQIEFIAEKQYYVCQKTQLRLGLLRTYNDLAIKVIKSLT